MKVLTPDQLEQALLEEEASIARSRSRQMEMLLLADEMQLPTADGCKSMREWVAGRLDMSPETAYSLTTTARRLADMPELVEQLAAGQITFDRAAATSRIPNEHQDDRLLGLDIQGLRRIATRHRRMERVDDTTAHASQHFTMQPNLDESLWNVWGKLDGYGGAVVAKVLTEEANLLESLPDGERPGLGYRQAVALAKVCEDRRPGTGNTPLITVFVDANGAETEAGTPVGPEIIDKVACVGSVEVIKNVDGEPLSVGRRSRVISKRLKRFVLHRDGGCSADGCTSRYRLEPHHKVPWSEGGPTDANNLFAFCWFHHHVVIHGWGYRIDSSRGPNRIRFIKPDHDPP
ncbi:MAG: DUF222 domain-containing protein [Acidimicrobiia bacterium]